MTTEETHAALKRAGDALRQIHDIEARFQAASTRGEIAELVIQVSEAQRALSAIRDAVTQKSIEINSAPDDTPGTAPTYPEA